MTDPRVSIHRVPLVRHLSPVRDLQAYRTIKRLLSITGAELLHTHMAKAGSLGRLAASRMSPRPVTVHTFHGHVLEAYFSRPVEKSFIAVERRLARSTDALVAVSEHVRDELLGLGIGAPEQWRVIPLGFDLGRFLSIEGPSGIIRERLGLSEDVFLAGVIGRLAPIKDHATLLRAIARAGDVHLAVLGDGSEAASLKAQAERAGIADRVHFLGWVMDVAGAIADMDLVVLTSRNEGTPVSLIEASAAAKPVLSTDVGGVRSVVVHEETGLLVGQGDDAAVASAISRFLREPESRRRMGAAGRRFVSTRFGKDRLLAEIADLYEELLARPRP